MSRNMSCVLRVFRFPQLMDSPAWFSNRGSHETNRTIKHRHRSQTKSPKTSRRVKPRHFLASVRLTPRYKTPRFGGRPQAELGHPLSHSPGSSHPLFHPCGSGHPFSHICEMGFVLPLVSAALLGESLSHPSEVVLCLISPAWFILSHLSECSHSLFYPSELSR